jgi:hypothetical protein
MKSIPSITLRIDYKTYRNFRKYFKANKGESAASYFQRLGVYLEEVQREINFKLTDHGDIE